MVIIPISTVKPQIITTPAKNYSLQKVLPSILVNISSTETSNYEQSAMLNTFGLIGFQRNTMLILQ